MLIIALVIALPILAVIIAALVHDVRDDGSARRTERRERGGLTPVGHMPMDDGSYGTPFSSPGLR